MFLIAAAGVLGTAPGAHETVQLVDENDAALVLPRAQKQAAHQLLALPVVLRQQRRCGDVEEDAAALGCQRARQVRFAVPRTRVQQASLPRRQNPLEQLRVALRQDHALHQRLFRTLQANYRRKVLRRVLRHNLALHHVVKTQQVSREAGRRGLQNGAVRRNRILLRHLQALNLLLRDRHT